MRWLAAVLCLAVAAHAFHEEFGADWESRWAHSSDEKYAGKFVRAVPKGLSDEGLKVPEKAKHYGIATVLDTPIDPAQGLVLQYDVKLEKGLTCGGAYMKFLTASESLSAADLKDNTPYTVMFGPDKCGATNKVHLILRYKSPKTGEIEEKHLKYPPTVSTDDMTHVYTAVLYPANNSYAVLVDGVEKKSGSLLTDFDPAFLPPAEIDDPEDSKPEDWVDEAKIPDPTATKPDDWDEDAPRTIPDPEATKPEGWLDDEPEYVEDTEAEKPEDWDDEEDGDWEAPQIPNPKCKEAPGCGEWKPSPIPNPDYKGKWSAPMIDNPEYKGKWAPRKIPNPDYFTDDNPLSAIGQVGGIAIEIWTMDEGIYFDNVVVANTAEEAAAVRDATWAPKHAVEEAVKEEERKKREEEEEKKRAAEGKKSETGIALASIVFDQPFLLKYAEQLAPVRSAVEANPALLASPLLLLLPLVLSLRGKKKKVDVAAVAKKQDITQADDKPAPANGAAKKSEGEIEEEEDESEGDDKPAGARRRAVRRD